MIYLDLLKKPNQALTFTHKGNLWNIRLTAGNGVMFADIHLNSETIVLGQRVVADMLIIPYRYLSQEGNFAILTNDGEIPWWEEFELRHELVFFTPEEAL